jgi:twitching motility protein PilT
MASIRTTLIQELLQEVWDRKGTDLLLTAGSPPLIRVDGLLDAADNGEELDARGVEQLVRETLPEALNKKLDQEKEVDFSFTFDGLARFRGSAFHQRGSLAMTLRLIPLEIPSFVDLGLPLIVEELAKRPSGLVLVTGPTGSGKSTTLASIIDYINQNRACHILTIEEPIEYLHNHKKAAVNQREVGDDTDSFARALRSALREDPDVLLVGEMRDLESIATALTIAETGHLVFATLHTNDTAQALDRIIDVFPSDRHPQIRVQLASSLAAVIYQRLLPKKDGGLVAAFEVMLGTHAVRNVVREGKNRQLRNIVATSRSEGMQTLEHDLSELVLDDLIDYEIALGASLYPKEIEKPIPPMIPEPGAAPEQAPQPVAATNGGRFRRH